MATFPVRSKGDASISSLKSLHGHYAGKLAFAAGKAGRRDAAKAAIRTFMARYPADPHRQQVAEMLKQLHNPFDD
jgi:hypothetical protein